MSAVLLLLFCSFPLNRFFLFGFVDMQCSAEAQPQRRDKPFLSSPIACARLYESTVGLGVCCV